MVSVGGVVLVVAIAIVMCYSVWFVLLCVSLLLYLCAFLFLPVGAFLSCLLLGLLLWLCVAIGGGTVVFVVAIVFCC